MRILFDHNTPHILAHSFKAHTVIEARTEGWERLSNGELLNAAEANGFDVLVTADKNIRHQQNLGGRKIAIVVLGQGNRRLILPFIANVVAAVEAATPGSYTVVEIPWGPRRVRPPRPQNAE